MTFLLPEEPWKGVGIPGESTIVELLYNAASQSLVAIVTQKIEGPPITRLYRRRLPEVTYHAIAVRDALESQEGAQSCQAAPYLFFNERRYRELPDPAQLPEYLRRLQPRSPRCYGGTWMGVRRLDLRTGEDKRILDAETLRAFPPYADWRIASLMSVAADGASAICRVVVGTATVSYGVYEVSFTEGLGRKIADLPHAFL